MIRPSRRPVLHVLAVLALGVLAAACGGGDDGLPAIGDDSTCDEVEDVVVEAIDQARLFIGTEDDDLARGDDLVFALSAADARPECLDESTANAARGLRLTIVETSGS